ncbi:MAG: TonB-dependent siderophore receptor [Sphingobium sp.]|nr:TonB-dependent siderophore receptor [Sphingobium sp.]
MTISSSFSSGLRVALLFSASALPGAAFAQGAPADSEAGRDDIIVIATGHSVAGTSSRTDTPIIESPQTISIINDKEMELRGVQTVSEAVAYTAGVLSEAGGMDSRVDEITLRGLGAGGFSTNNSFIDGLRLPSGGQWTRIAFDPYALEQIEVLKGPSSILFGQSAPGGVINMVSKRANAEGRKEVVLSGTGFNELGRWNYQGAVDVGGALNSNGTVSARVVGLARDGKGALQGVSNSRYYISPSITWQPNEDVELTLLGQYQRDEGGSTFQFLPMTGTLNPSNGKHIENDAFIGEPDWNVFDRNQYLLGAFLKAQLNENLRFVANARYTKVDTLYRAIVLSGDTLTACPGNIPGCVVGATVGRRGVQGVGDSTGIAIDTHVQGTFRTGALEHMVVAGLDFSSTDWSHNRDNVTPALVLPILNIFDPVHRGAANFASSLASGIHTNTQNDQTGIFLQDTISIGGLRLTIGGRQDWAYDETLDTISNYLYSTKTKDFTWRAGAVYLFDNGLAPYFSYATSFQPVTADPTSNIVVGQGFKPMTGEQWEGGLRYQHGSKAYFTLSGYEITQQNMVSSIGGARCGQYNVLCNAQTGEVRFRGAEFEARVNTNVGVTILGSVTRTWTKIQESRTVSEIGNRFLNTPDWMASAFVSYSFKGLLDGFGLGGGVRYVGESFGDNANTFAIPDRTLFDAMLRYDFGPSSGALNGMSFSVNARNLSDKRYVSTCTATSGCYYGTGRTVTARLSYRW